MSTVAAMAAVALAQPPRAEVLGSWSAGAASTYASATVQPALVLGEAGSVQLRGTVSRATARWSEGDALVTSESAGLAVGPAVVRTLGDLSIGAGLGVAGRRTTTRVAGRRRDEVSLDALATGDLFWRPGQRAQVYGQLALGLAAPSLWIRSGATCPVTPRDQALSLWLGAEGTTSGAPSSLATAVGPVAELPVRPLRASLALRASHPLAELGRGIVAWEHTTVGAAFYWAYAPRR